MKKNIKVAIMGCGDVAGRYDEKKNSDGVFSHAGAYRSFSNIEIVAAYDVDKKRLDDFCRFWKIKNTCRNQEELFAGDYDIVSICTPDDTHESMLERSIRRRCAKYIWAEKPLTTTASSAEKIMRLAKDGNIGVMLSNQRRWEPGHLAVKEKLQKGVIGDLVCATGYYVKGITHIGCTTIDTLRFLCGEVIWASSFPPFDNGSYANDRSLRGLLGFKNGATACIVGCDKNEYAYSIFEIDIIGTKGRIKIEENGDVVYIYQLKQYDHYEGFKELKLSKKIDTKMKYAMKYGLELILKDLSGDVRRLHFVEDGVKDLRIVDSLKRSALSGGIKVEV